MKRLVFICLAILSLQVNLYADSKVKIREPDGVPLQPVQSPDKYLRQYPFCFEWQYVHIDNDKVPYYTTQCILGKVTPIPDRSYNWSVSAGELIREWTSYPKFKPANMPLPNTRVDVDLELRAYPGDDTYMDTKTLEVYRDHLQRDIENFGQNECGSPQYDIFFWSFNRYGSEWRALRTWNCFGSVWHAFNGSGNGHRTTVPGFPIVYDESEPNIDWGVALNGVQRGDFISYWHGDVMEHAATFIDATTTYGANNRPGWGMQVPRGDECGHGSDALVAGNNDWWMGTSWEWWYCTPQLYYKLVNEYKVMATGEIFIDRIKIHKKP